MVIVISINIAHPNASSSSNFFAFSVIFLNLYHEGIKYLVIHNPHQKYWYDYSAYTKSYNNTKYHYIIFVYFHTYTSISELSPKPKRRCCNSWTYCIYLICVILYTTLKYPLIVIMVITLTPKFFL